MVRTENLISFRAGKKDLDVFHQVASRDTKFLSENHTDDLSQVVVKPWGHESRVYADLFQDVWHLCIADGHCTSMHAHMRKTTKLLCLSGEGTFDTLTESVKIVPGTVLVVGPGVFHRTTSTSDQLHLIEVELPRNKFDLVRFKDDYNRQPTVYESKVTSFGESKLRVTNKATNASLRSISTLGKFSFDIRTGMDIFYTPKVGDLFYIPVGLEAFASNKPLISLGDGQKPDVDTAAQYLTVTKR